MGLTRETPLHALAAFLRDSQLLPTSTNDQSPHGQSFCAGLYPEGGVNPKELDNCSCKSSWKHLKGQSTHLQLRLDVAVLIMRTGTKNGVVFRHRSNRAKTFCCMYSTGLLNQPGHGFRSFHCQPENVKCWGSKHRIV